MQERAGEEGEGVDMSLQACVQWMKPHASTSKSYSWTFKGAMPQVSCALLIQHHQRAFSPLYVRSLAMQDFTVARGVDLLPRNLPILSIGTANTQ